VLLDSQLEIVTEELVPQEQTKGPELNIKIIEILGHLSMLAAERQGIHQLLQAAAQDRNDCWLLRQRLVVFVFITQHKSGVQEYKG